MTKGKSIVASLSLIVITTRFCGPRCTRNHYTSLCSHMHYLSKGVTWPC